MDPYLDIAPFYDFEHDLYTDDIDFYRQIVQAGPVLEVGVGTGRVMRTLLDGRREVWGIDVSAAMLARARERTQGWDRAHLEEQSVVQLNLSVRFETVLMPLNALSHLREIDDQVAALVAIRRHVVDGAMLVIDQLSPFTAADRGGNGEVRRRFSRRIGDESISGWSAAWDDESEQLLTLQLWFDTVRNDGPLRRTETSLALRYFYRFELELLLRQTGFRVAQVYGSYELEPFTAASRRLIFVAFAT